MNGFIRSPSPPKSRAHAVGSLLIAFASAGVTVFRELHSLLHHLFDEATGVMPGLPPLEASQLRATITAQALLEYNRTIHPPPTNPAAAAAAPVAATATEPPGADTASEEVEVLRATRLPVGLAFLELAIAAVHSDGSGLGNRSGTTEIRRVREGGMALIRMWPSIQAAGVEVQQLQEVLGRQTNQLSWTPWLDLTLDETDVADSPSRPKKSLGSLKGASKELWRVTANSDLAAARRFLAAVKQRGMVALVEASACEGAQVSTSN